MKSRNNTLFLDRDGVINKQIKGGFVTSWEEFEFIDGALPAITEFSKLFSRILIVTNQRAIREGVFLSNDLDLIHAEMLKFIVDAGGQIDKIYYCSHRKDEFCYCRKPRPGMVYLAKKDYPEIDFRQSVLIGDSDTDIMLGKSMGMATMQITDKQNSSIGADLCCVSLAESLAVMQSAKWI